jgi:hypothetical protein
MDTFSRDFLRGLPEHTKQERIDIEIDRFIDQLRAAAAAGDRSYFHIPSDLLNNPFSTTQRLQPITDQDLLDGIRRRFTDCTVSLQYALLAAVDTKKQELQKGILIDWS